MNNDLLRLDYEQTLLTFRQLADIRFKLLAFVPTVSGAVIAILTQGPAEGVEQAGLGGLGLLVVIGVILYDQRNTQFYNGSVSRAQHLEAVMDLPAFEGDRNPGLFGSRRDHHTRYVFGLEVAHDIGIAFIYSPVVGAWTFVLIQGATDGNTRAAAVAGACAFLFSLAQLMWHGGRPKRLKELWKKRATERSRPPRV